MSNNTSGYNAPFQYNNEYRTEAVPPEISIVILNDDENLFNNNRQIIPETANKYLDQQNYKILSDFKPIDIGAAGEKKFDFVVYKNKSTDKYPKIAVTDRGYVIIKKTNNKDIVFTLANKISRENNDLDNPFNIYYILAKIFREDNKKYSSNFNKIIQLNQFSERKLPNGNRKRVIENEEIEMQDLGFRLGQAGGGESLYENLYKRLPNGEEYKNNCFFYLGQSKIDSDNKLFEGIPGYSYFIQAQFSGLISTQVYFPAIIRISSDILKYILIENKTMLSKLNLLSNPIIDKYNEVQKRLLKNLSSYDMKKILRIIPQKLGLTQEQLDYHNFLIGLYPNRYHLRANEIYNNPIFISLKEKFETLKPNPNDRIYKERVDKMKEMYGEADRMASKYATKTTNSK